MMGHFNPDIHHRRSIRLPSFDYSSAGAYFVTICAYQRENIFGEIRDGEMKENEAGTAVRNTWDSLPAHYSFIELDEFVLMPNHVHGIIWIRDPVGAGLKPAPTKKRHPLSEIVRGFKTFSSRHINVQRKSIGNHVWQRNYYERVIRTDAELFATRQYIQDNPTAWSSDPENV